MGSIINKKIVILGTLAIAASCYSLFFTPKKADIPLLAINKFVNQPDLTEGLISPKLNWDLLQST